MRSEPPWDDIDPGIREVVRAFHERRFETISSCQGHASGDAFVTVLVREDQHPWEVAQEVASFAAEKGWGAACIVEARWHLESGERWVTAWWWGALPFR